MRTVLYRCPINGMNVQWHYQPHAPSEEEPAEVYEAITCPACSNVHLFNRSSGTLGVKTSFDRKP